MTGGFHSKTGQPPSVLPEPPLESPAAHPSGIGQFIFVRAFHGISFFTLQRYEINLIYARKRTTKNTDNRAQNRQTRTKGVSALPRCRTFAVEFKNTPQLGAQPAVTNSRIRNGPSPDLPQRGGEEAKKQPNFNL